MPLDQFTTSTVSFDKHSILVGKLKRFVILTKPHVVLPRQLKQASSIIPFKSYTTFKTHIL